MQIIILKFTYIDLVIFIPYFDNYAYSASFSSTLSQVEAGNMDPDYKRQSFDGKMPFLKPTFLLYPLLGTINGQPLAGHLTIMHLL